MLSNVEAIERTLGMLDSEDPVKRVFAAKTLGGLCHGRTDGVTALVVEKLRNLAGDKSQDSELRRLAGRSVREVRGDFDRTWGKYFPPAEFLCNYPCCRGWR